MGRTRYYPAMTGLLGQTGVDAERHPIGKRVGSNSRLSFFGCDDVTVPHHAVFAPVGQNVARQAGQRRHALYLSTGEGIVSSTGETSLPVVGEIDWGDLRRASPFCAEFGFSRGTPIDRYYLNLFVAEICDQLHGDVVEIGGKNHNKNSYGFSRVFRYRGLNLIASPGVELIGDAAQSQCLPPSSLDGLVAFNVLEHTPRPWQIVNNMRLWLREGGVACCMVPNAQRLHKMPEDYWRPLPAALMEMFTGWSERRLYQYGNPVSTVASLMGIAAEELEEAELIDYHPDYPVASCIFARK